jgi:hypothetical protein
VKCTQTDNDDTCTRGDNLTPINNNGNMLTDPQIHAAMLALDHSFGVQLYSLGNPFGTLNVYGSISQMFRGAVGTGSGGVSTGYAKGYVYDTRLKFAPPPFYLNPVSAKYISAVFSEIPPAY